MSKYSDLEPYIVKSSLYIVSWFVYSVYLVDLYLYLSYVYRT